MLMQSVGDEVFSGAGFAVYDHGDVGHRQATDEAENLAHRQAFPQQLAQVRTFVRKDENLPCRGSDFQNGRTDSQPPAREQVAFGDTDTIDERPVTTVA